MTERTITMDAQLLWSAIVDGINRYGNEVLIARNLVDRQAMRQNDEELLCLRNEIVNDLVDRYMGIAASDPDSATIRFSSKRPDR